MLSRITAFAAAAAIALSAASPAAAAQPSYAGYPAGPVSVDRLAYAPAAAAAGQIVSVSVADGAASVEDPDLSIDIAATGSPVSMTVSLAGPAPAAAVVASSGPVPFAPEIHLSVPRGMPFGDYTATASVTDADGSTSAGSASVAYAQANRILWASVAADYTIDATLAFTTGKITATETVVAVNNEASATSALHFSVLARYWGEMAVSSVSVDGIPVTVSYPSAADMAVPLGFNLAPGDAATIVIAFTATAKATTGTSLEARFSKVGALMQISSWHPVLSTGHGMRYPGDSQASAAGNYHVTLRMPSTVRAATPGNSTVSTVGTTTTVRAELAGAREFAWAASTAFVTATYKTTALNSSGGVISVMAYYLSGTAGASASTLAKDAVNTLTPLLGAYPYSRLIVAQSTRSVSGNEYPGIVFIGSGLLANASVVKHEVAHQWFYGLVGNDQLAAPWLDEAFAEYWGRRAIGATTLPAYSSVYAVDRAATAWPNAAANDLANGYNQTIYAKGCHMLGDLRVRIGAAAFDAAMKAIVTDFRGKVVTEADVVAEFSRFSSKAVVEGFLYPAWLTR
jgi:hypothetical protein